MLGVLVKRATAQCSSVVLAPQLRTLRGAPPMTEVNDNDSDSAIGAGQPNWRTSKAGRLIMGKIIEEKFEKYPIRQTRSLREPLPMIDLVRSEKLRENSKKKEYREDEQAKFDEVAEIGKEDALQDYRISQFDAAFLDTVGPGIRPVYNVAALADKVEVIQKLIHLGVSMYEWDKKPHITQNIIKLDWNRDCEPRIELLVNHGGVDPADLSIILTKNPLLLCEEFQLLDTRIKYLQAEISTKWNEGGWGMKSNEIGRIITKDPFWLSFSVERLENRLDFFKNQFKLDKTMLKKLMTIYPKVITANLRMLILNKLSMSDEFGFKFHEIQNVLMTAPKLFTMNKQHLLLRFDILHGEIGYDHEMIATVPKVLFCRDFRLKQRLEFLRHLDRAQFNPKLPAFVTPIQIATTSDEIFVTKVAKSTMEEFENFIKMH
ncbi:transcription termination factor 3, mitochondrial-like isoform X1 [Varroa jacobsoni]|uniref:transcription termination factor 3, mitochondrial-like isoform X1 n=1 Tax=Varroa jacobsoni TaxID=62625 RepID=UPI000BF60982|nr:transcription termination factor 3, mitochondrial-like isoform X1 [Varroa jacobsoni]XP_022693249.1 transcription termination factor 3, mitochondrial-like isoform X1 [Varroa jacobsoni]